jgi:putative Mn2+ efflux pump MntP
MEKHEHHFLKLAGKIVITTVLTTLAVLLLGYFLRWNQPVQYSNGFFIAGAILVVLGVYTVAGGFAQRANFGITYAESAGQADIAERNQRTAADITQRYGTMIFLVTTGLLLILTAIVIGRIFPST